MRKTVRFDRTVRIMVPVWHFKEQKGSNSKRLIYNRAMVIHDLHPGIEHECDTIQAMLNRGAIIPSEEYNYICSYGFIPELHESNPVPPDYRIGSEVSTGLDPEEDLN